MTTFAVHILSQSWGGRSKPSSLEGLEAQALLHHCDLGRCFKAKSSAVPQFPLPLCITAWFPPALCRGFASSFTPAELYFPGFPHCNANRLAVGEQGLCQPGRRASTAPGKAQQSRLHLGCQHRYTEMLLPTAAQADAQGKMLFPAKNPKKPGIVMSQKGVRGVSPVLVFFKYQFKLHCIH